MTNIEQKALALVNEILKERRIGGDCDTIYRATDATDEALCRAFEQHEAFRQEVSEAVAEYFDCQQNGSRSMFEVAEMRLHSFIIPKPKSDPLVAALEGVTFDHYPPNDAKTIRAALDALGFEIREKNDD